MENINPSVSPTLVAEHILWLRREIESTPMHVIKLVYLSHGWMLGFTGRSLINEAVEAWHYGPVVPTIYHRYKSFGGGGISTELLDLSDGFDDKQEEVIELVDSVYKDCNALDLSSLTHKPGTPWDITRSRYGIGSIIPNELIRKHYEGLLETGQS